MTDLIPLSFNIQTRDPKGIQSDTQSDKRGLWESPHPLVQNWFEAKTRPKNAGKFLGPKNMYCSYVIENYFFPADKL